MPPLHASSATTTTSSSSIGGAVADTGTGCTPAAAAAAAPETAGTQAAKATSAAAAAAAPGRSAGCQAAPELPPTEAALVALGCSIVTLTPPSSSSGGGCGISSSGGECGSPYSPSQSSPATDSPRPPPWHLLLPWRHWAASAKRPTAAAHVQGILAEASCILVGTGCVTLQELLEVDPRPAHRRRVPARCDVEKRGTNKHACVLCTASDLPGRRSSAGR
jgi:hypothetical protein